MRMEINVLRVLLLLFVFQKEESKATKCYQCNSQKDEDCTTSIANIKYLKPCPLSQPFCRKALYIYYFLNSREYITIRECSKWWNVNKECYRGRYARDTYQFICECKGAGCNRSSRPNPKPSTIFLHISCSLTILLVRNPT